MICLLLKLTESSKLGSLCSRPLFWYYSWNSCFWSLGSLSGSVNLSSDRLKLQILGELQFYFDSAMKVGSSATSNNRFPSNPKMQTTVSCNTIFTDIWPIDSTAIQVAYRWAEFGKWSSFYLSLGYFGEIGFHENWAFLFLFFFLYPYDITEASYLVMCGEYWTVAHTSWKRNGNYENWGSTNVGTKGRPSISVYCTVIRWRRAHEDKWTRMHSHTCSVYWAGFAHGRTLL